MSGWIVYYKEQRFSTMTTQGCVHQFRVLVCPPFIKNYYHKKTKVLIFQTSSYMYTCHHKKRYKAMYFSYKMKLGTLYQCR